jgi:hypothetical protein
MRRVMHLGLLVAMTLTFTANWVVVASAKPKPPARCTNPSRYGSCVVAVGSPGRRGRPPAPGVGTGSAACVEAGRVIPCSRSGLGYWDAGLGCYLALMSPQPPRLDPAWQGHRTGAVFMCTTWPPRPTGTTEVWLVAPPAGPDPRVLALRALRTLRLPQPSGNRSPNESQRFTGVPFTYVNLWTWFWTAPGLWSTRTATARAGAVSATVTVTPVALTFTPGDGSPPVSCPGPGRAWRSADGDRRPTGGGCGYRYRWASAAPIESVQSIRWSVSWRASDGESGALPDLVTSRADRLMVLQVESVVTR